MKTAVKRALKPAPKRGAKPAVKRTPSLVRDVMTAKPICAESGDSLRDLARLLDQNEISGVPVVDDQDRLLGVVSRTDLVRRLLEGPADAPPSEDWLDLLTADSVSTFEIDVARLGTVDDVMSIDPVTATLEETAATVARRLAAARVHRAIVVDPSRRPIGVVTTLDLLKVFPH